MARYYPPGEWGAIASAARKRGVSRQAESGRRLRVFRRAAGLCVRCGNPSEHYWCDTCYKYKFPGRDLRHRKVPREPKVTSIPGVPTVTAPPPWRLRKRRGH